MTTNMQADPTNETTVRQRTKTGVIWLGLAAALTLTACGNSSAGPKVADAGTPSAAAPASGSGTATRDNHLAFSQCMRANGVTKFPDPPADGGPTILTSDVDPSSPAFQAAQPKCQPLLTGGVKAAQANRPKMLKFSACMRKNGVPNFPDPDANGSLSFGTVTGGGAAQDAQTKAMAACQNAGDE